MTVTDEMLAAYVDGELGEAQRMAVDSAVAADPVLLECLERHRRLRARLGGAFAPVLDEPVPERLLAAARPSNVVDLSARRGSLAPWAAMAACVAAGLIAGVSLQSQPMIGADLTAHGQLAGALEKQLASAPSGGEAVKVGLTFKSADGYCRTFTGEAVAGLACREGSSWKVRMAVAQTAGPGGDYRTASSQTPAAVLDAAQGLMVGEPLDADAEKAARANGWR